MHTHTHTHKQQNTKNSSIVGKGDINVLDFKESCQFCNDTIFFPSGFQIKSPFLKFECLESNTLATRKPVNGCIVQAELFYKSQSIYIYIYILQEVYYFYFPYLISNNNYKKKKKKKHK